MFGNRPLNVLRLLAALVVIPAAMRWAGDSRGGDVERLRWMAGCWELAARGRVIHEQWMAPAGGMMLGMSRTVVRDSVREYEQLRIETRNGVATYVAQPSGQAATTFAATHLSDSSVTFANPAHDFPQRIMYHRVGADSLIARIEGDRGGKLQGMTFPMRRAACGE